MTTSCVKKSDWSSVTSALQSRLDASIGASTDEMRQLLNGLWTLRKLGDSKAEKALKTLVTDGHIAHHHHQAAKHKEGAALCALTILHEDPKTAAPPGVGNSASGHQVLTNALATSDKDSAAALCAALRNYSTLPDLFDIIDARGECDLLLATCLQCIADSESPQDLFTGEVLLKRWPQIQDALSVGNDDKPFDHLVTKLANENKLCDAIESSDKGFSTDDATLYWTIVRGVGAENPTFSTWCRDGLEGLDKEAWLSDLRDSCQCVWLACMLADNGVKTRLTTPLSDALADHAGELVKGEHVPEDVVVKRWHDAMSLLEESTRKALRPRLLTVAVAADGKLSQQFLEMYSGDFGDPDVLSSNSRTVEGCFSPIVRERNFAGLHWLIDFFKSNGAFLDAASSRDNVEEFRTRLQDCVNSPEADEAQPLIEELATLLGIEAEIMMDSAEAAESA